MNERLKQENEVSLAIVEDDNTVREGLRMLLSGSSGYLCVATFSNGEDAIKEIPRLKPDVVLMDINLPGINGIECIKKLKRQNENILFIMLTVFEDTEAIFNSLKAGASGYLLKNTPPSKLIESIKEVNNGGSPMSGEIARKVVDSFSLNLKTGSNRYSDLTYREEEVLSLLAKGFLYKEIADQMNISIDTVRSHIRKIYDKLHVKTRTEAVLVYLQS
jgi:DNA-binding NarL/FixJ family response regulator